MTFRGQRVFSLNMAGSTATLDKAAASLMCTAVTNFELVTLDTREEYDAVAFYLHFVKQVLKEHVLPPSSNQHKGYLII